MDFLRVIRRITPLEFVHCINTRSFRNRFVLNEKGSIDLGGLDPLKKAEKQIEHFKHVFAKYPHELKNMDKLLAAAAACRELGHGEEEYGFLQIADKLSPNHQGFLEHMVDYHERWIEHYKGTTEDLSPLKKSLRAYEDRLGKLEKKLAENASVERLNGIRKKALADGGELIEADRLNGYGLERFMPTMNIGNKLVQFGFDISVLREIVKENSIFAVKRTHLPGGSAPAGNHLHVYCENEGKVYGVLYDLSNKKIVTIFSA